MYAAAVVEQSQQTEPPISQGARKRETLWGVEGEWGSRTSGDSVDLVLEEVVHQRDEGAEEGGGEALAVLDGGGVRRAKGDAADGPGEGDD